jgi:cytochrome c peroxidase
MAAFAAAILLPAAAAAAQLSPAAALGKRLFFDPALSASGRMSCATCHDPAHAYAPPNGLAVQLGGADLKQAGTRAVPSLMYKQRTQAYSDLYNNPDQISPPAPGGGFTWDGRADTLAGQAAIPLLAANEMANRSRAEVVAKIRRAPYAAQLQNAFGTDVFRDTGKAFAAAMQSLQAFQLEDPSFYPFSSKFDRYRNNKIGGQLSAAEKRGLVLYLSRDKGNCSACHLLGGGGDGSHDMTTDYSYEAIGVPRNLEIPANADPRHFDLGLCGPVRPDRHRAHAAGIDSLCGMFKTPTLRNVATRSVFMHNGYFKKLEDVLRFYNTRDTQPQLWYPSDRHGQVLKFDDLPAAYRGNIDKAMPLDLRPAGSAPALSDQELVDLLAFLQTLTDGFEPAAGGARIP